MVYLSARVLLRVPDGRRGRRLAQPGVQSRRLRQQDRVLPRHLEFRQDGHRREARQPGASPQVNCQVLTLDLIVWFFSLAAPPCGFWTGLASLHRRCLKPPVQAIARPWLAITCEALAT